MLGILLSAQQITVLEMVGDPKQGKSRKQIQRVVRRLLTLVLRPEKPRMKDDEGVTRQRPLRGVYEVDDLSLGEWTVSWKKVFMWQCPIMFMSYSVCLYLLGLTLYVCSPLIAGDFAEYAWVSLSSLHQEYRPVHETGNNKYHNFDCLEQDMLTIFAKQVAFIYLGFAAVTTSTFMACSFWIYRDADIESDDTTFTDDDDEYSSMVVRDAHASDVQQNAPETTMRTVTCRQPARPEPTQSPQGGEGVTGGDD